MTESELTLYDINIFLKYISLLEGKGSSEERIRKILTLMEGLSKLEGLYFLKIIDKKLTIGATSKTFNKILQ